MSLRTFVASFGLAVLAACGGSSSGPAPSSGGVIEVKAGPGQIVLSPTDIKRWEVVEAPEGYRIRVELAPAASQNLARVTRANVGRKVPIVIHGEVVMDPLVRDPIESGRLEISGRSKADLQRIQRLLQ
jgi:preprotein translocase subunit SecD